MAFDLSRIVRPNIARLSPYSSARSEFTGQADVFLDANENSFGSPAGTGLNRYPDPLQKKLKVAIGELKGVEPERIFVGNGSDEAIDLLFRIFCVPGKDEVIVCPPTYGMYRVSADINDVAVREVPLRPDYQLDTRAISDATRENTKLIFVCSPNNPTGNRMRREDIVQLSQNFEGVLVVDEAYIDFAAEPSLLEELATLPNMVLLQTFSKAWGMAGVRVGLAFASEQIVDLMNKVKPPYNVSEVAQQVVLDAITRKEVVTAWIDEIISERESLSKDLQRLGIVRTVYPSDANFLLVKFADARQTYDHLVSRGIVVRDRSSVMLCGDSLRITIGTADENRRLVDVLAELDGKGNN